MREEAAEEVQTLSLQEETCRGFFVTTVKVHGPFFIICSPLEQF